MTVEITTGTGGTEQVWGGTGQYQQVGQTFLTIGAFNLSSVTVLLSKPVGSPSDNITAYLYSVTGAVPNAQLATSTNTIAGSSLTGSLVKKTFSFANVALSAATSYAIVFARDTLSDANEYGVGKDFGSYADGTLVEYEGAWSDISAWDLGLEIISADVQPTNGWMKQLNQAPPILALPLAAALTWCPQPITQAAAATPTLAWQAPLSKAPSIVNVARSFAFVPLAPPAVSTAGWQAPLSSAAQPVPVQRSFSFVPFNTVQPSNSLTMRGWQQPLSRAQQPVPLTPGFSFVPFDKPQVSAPVIGIAWQVPLSIAPPSVPRVPYAQPQLVPLANPQISFGWQAPLSTAVQVTIRNQGGQLSFVVPPFVVPSGWQQPLSTAPQALKAPASFAYVPFDTVQTVIATPNLQWQQPLSAAPPPVKATQGFAFVPFDTPQISVQVVSYGWQGPLSVAQPATAATINSAFSFVALPFPQYPTGWQQPLSVAPPVANAQRGLTSFVPFDTPQLVVQVASYGWQSALSVAPSAVKAPQNYSYVPFGAQQVVSLAWQAPLSVAPAAAKALQGASSFVPLNATQAQPAGIAGMAWYSPLSAAPQAAAKPLQDASFVPLNTVQVTPSGETEIHNHPFFATVGQLMGGM